MGSQLCLCLSRSSSALLRSQTKKKTYFWIPKNTLPLFFSASVILKLRNPKQRIWCGNLWRSRNFARWKRYGLYRFFWAFCPSLSGKTKNASYFPAMINQPHLNLIIVSKDFFLQFFNHGNPCAGFNHQCQALYPHSSWATSHTPPQHFIFLGFCCFPVWFLGKTRRRLKS